MPTSIVQIVDLKNLELPSTKALKTITHHWLINIVLYKLLVEWTKIDIAVRLFSTKSAIPVIQLSVNHQQNVLDCRGVRRAEFLCRSRWKNRVVF